MPKSQWRKWKGSTLEVPRDRHPGNAMDGIRREEFGRMREKFCNTQCFNSELLATISLFFNISLIYIYTYSDVRGERYILMSTA